MQEDNAYPSDGRAFHPLGLPDDQKKALDKERAEVELELSQIQKVIEHFKERIAFRDSIKAIAVDISENPELHQKTCAVNELIVEALTQEKELLEALIEDTTR